MIFGSPAELKERAIEVTGRRVYGDVRIVEDTSNYLTIDSYTVLRLADNDYFVLADAKEGRFGIPDQPKMWVKYAVCLTTGQRKIIKLVFHEQFQTSLGQFTVRCQRSPDKESAVLKLVEGDERFMQGITLTDVAGNNVRIIDRIEGQALFNHIVLIEESHEQYYHETLPGILRKLVGCIEAMAFLHRQGLEHGDIRNDHIFVERSTGAFRWIDFDYSVNFSDYDIWSMGNVLTYAVGKGIVTCREAAQTAACQTTDELGIGPDDALLLARYRLANLRKKYPYIDESLNDLLMRFSAVTRDFFLDFDAMAEALRKVLDQLPAPPREATATSSS